MLNYTNQDRFAGSYRYLELLVIVMLVLLSVFAVTAPVTNPKPSKAALKFLPENPQLQLASAQEALQHLDAFVPIPLDGLPLRRNRQDVWIFVPPMTLAPPDRALLYLDFVRLDHAEIYLISPNSVQLIGETGVSIPREQRMVPQLRFPYLLLTDKNAEKGYLVRARNDLPVKLKIELQSDSIEARAHETFDNLYLGALIGFGLLAMSIAIGIFWLCPDRLNGLYLLGAVLAFTFLAHYNRLTEFFGLSSFSYWVNILDAVLAGSAICVATLLLLEFIPRSARVAPVTFLVHASALLSMGLPLLYTVLSGRNPANILGLSFALSLAVSLWLGIGASKMGFKPSRVGIITIAPLVVGALLASLRDAGLLSNEAIFVKGAVELGLCTHVALALMVLFDRSIAKHALLAATRARSMRDPLTGLPDEHDLIQSLSHTVRRSARHGHTYGLLQIRCYLSNAEGESHNDRAAVLMASEIARANGDFGYLARRHNGDFVIIVEGLGSEENVPSCATRILAAILRLEMSIEGYKYRALAKIAFISSARGELSSPHALQTLQKCLDNWPNAEKRSIIQAARINMPK